MNLYAYSIHALKRQDQSDRHSKYEYQLSYTIWARHTAGVLVARNDYEAQDMALEEAKKTYLASEGYYGHSAVICTVPNETILKMANKILVIAPALPHLPIPATSSGKSSGLTGTR